MTCLIFDLDGTLIDSEPLSSQAFLDVLPDLDATPAELMRRYRGHKMAYVFEDISRRIGRPLPDDFEALYRHRVAALYDLHLKPMPGAPEMLGNLAYPCCVASNGPLAKMTHGLRATGLARFFGENLFSAYEVGHWKPEPQLFLHAAKQMGFAPADCVVIEDSESGLLAAAAAGMPAVHYCPEGMSRVSSPVVPISHLRDLGSTVENIRRIRSSPPSAGHASTPD